MWRRELLHRLAEYASVLRDGHDACHDAGLRGQWLRALAFVGLLLGAINDDAPLHEIRTLVGAEDDRFNFDFLALEDGKVAEEAWTSFRESLDEARV
jgi:hypothetical protein